MNGDFIQKEKIVSDSKLYKTVTASVNDFSVHGYVDDALIYLAQVFPLLERWAFSAYLNACRGKELYLLTLGFDNHLAFSCAFPRVRFGCFFQAKCLLFRRFKSDEIGVLLPNFL